MPRKQCGSFLGLLKGKGLPCVATKAKVLVDGPGIAGEGKGRVDLDDAPASRRGEPDVDDAKADGVGLGDLVEQGLGRGLGGAVLLAGDEGGGLDPAVDAGGGAQEDAELADEVDD